jgi:EmrB/QacA subfamily drug resistance transporter
MAFLDATVVGIAQPTIGREFHADIAGLQWVSIGYSLTLSGLLLLSGSLGDRLGRRRVFRIGVIWFAVASLFCAVTPNIGLLVAARTLQGIGGALLTPGSLAILEASFVPNDRARAIGAWSGLGGIASAIGPFLGGYLISAVSWRLIFLINLPFAAAVVAITNRFVPETRNPEVHGRIDIPGALLTISALTGLSYGLVEGSDLGWTSAPVLGSIAASLVAFAAFVVVEMRTAEPLLPLSIFRSRQFSATNVVTLLVYAVMGGMFFLLPIELIQVAHYSPIAAGAAFLPVTLMLLVLSQYSGALATRIGPRLQMSVGPIVVAVGFAMFARIDASGNYLTEILPAAIVWGLGLAITVAPLTATAMSSAPAEHAGIASAVNNTVARAGPLLAVALLPPLAGITGVAYLHPVQFENGFQHASVYAAIVCAVAGLIAAATIRNPPRSRARRAPETPTARAAVAIPPIGAEVPVDS